MLIYKVSPLRESLLFNPSVFYRTANFKSSSTRPKPGYIRDTVEWLRSKNIDLWRTPLPREAYAARKKRGENYGLFADGQLVAIVSLVRGAAKQWAEVLGERRRAGAATCNRE